MEFIKNCIICGNDNFSFFDELKALNSNEYFSLYKCNKCNLIFLNPRLSINKLVETENYTKLLSKKESDFNKNNLNEMIYSKKNIAKYKLIKKYYHNKHGRILDIGCSRGDFLKYMSLKNWLVCGTELSNDLTFVCDVKIIYGLNSLKKLISENQKFDVITLWAVLQHVYEPEILLKDCYKLLSENGLLFILVINSEAPNIKILKNIDVPRVLYAFNPENIKLFLEKNSFKIIDIDFKLSKNIFSSTLRGIIIYFYKKYFYRMKEKEIIASYRNSNMSNEFFKNNNRKKSSLDIKMINILDKIITNFFLDYIFIHFKKGSIMTIICKKK